MEIPFILLRMWLDSLAGKVLTGEVKTRIHPSSTDGNRSFGVSVLVDQNHSLEVRKGSDGIRVNVWSADFCKDKGAEIPMQQFFLQPYGRLYAEADEFLNICFISRDTEWCHLVNMHHQFMGTTEHTAIAP